jgi:predicted transcriptional regulator
MNTVEKKDFILSHINNISDDVVNDIFNKIKSYFEKEEKLSDELKAALDKGIESLEKGKSSTHEEVMSRMKAKYPDLIK